jgi:hypothetical protein
MFRTDQNNVQVPPPLCVRVAIPPFTLDLQGVVLNLRLYFPLPVPKI